MELGIFPFASRMARQYPQGIAFAEIERDGSVTQVTYAQYAQDLVSLSQQYRAFPQQRIALLASVPYTWMLNAFACVLAGKDTIMIDPALSAEDMITLLDYADAQAIVCQPGVEDMRDELRRGLPKVQAVAVFPKAGEVDADLPPVAEGRFLCFTSGTSQRAKGVVLDPRKVCGAAIGWEKAIAGKQGERAYLPLPMHHIYALAMTMVLLHRGETICYGRGVRYVARDIAAFDPHSLFVVPSMMEYLLKADAVNPSLRHAVLGASPSKQATIDQARSRGILIQNAYGMTETVGAVCVTPIDESHDGMMPLEAASFTITPEGEVLVHSEYLMDGYYNRPEDTADVLWEGTLATRDAGFLDAHGGLHITGRLKDIIVMSNGEKIFCVEVDERLAGMEEIEEAALFEGEGGALVAALVPAQGYGPQDVEGAIARFNAGQPYIRRIQKLWHHGSPLPRTASGKLKRAALQLAYNAPQ